MTNSRSLEDTLALARELARTLGPRASVQHWATLRPGGERGEVWIYAQDPDDGPLVKGLLARCEAYHGTPSASGLLFARLDGTELLVIAARSVVECLAVEALASALTS